MNVNPDSSWPQFDRIKAPFSQSFPYNRASFKLYACSQPPFPSSISIRLLPPRAGTSTPLTRPCGPCWRDAVVWLHSQQAGLPARLSWLELRGYSSQTQPQVSILPPSYSISPYFVLLQDVGLTLHSYSPKITIRGFQPRCCLQMQHVYAHRAPKILYSSLQWPNIGFKAKKKFLHIFHLETQFII